MMLKQTKHGGFTLIECLVVISIIAILTAMAVPSFRQLKDHAQQLQVIYQLHAAVLMARHLSIIEHSTALICPARAGMKIETSQSPACDENYDEGVALWSEQAMGWRLRRVWQWSSTTLTNRRGNRKVSETVVFNTQGLANRNLTWSTCVAQRNLSLVLNRVGRPEIRRQWGVC
jgi:prepilin-type N-terminal cleavage/methylation domain-containing protein